MTGEKVRLARRARLKYDAVRKLSVLLLPESVLELNAVGAEVVALCDGTRSEEEIVLAMTGRYASPDVERDVRAFLARFDARGLLERVMAGSEAN